MQTSVEGLRRVTEYRQFRTKFSAIDGSRAQLVPLPSLLSRYFKNIYKGGVSGHASLSPRDFLISSRFVTKFTSQIKCDRKFGISFIGNRIYFLMHRYGTLDIFLQVQEEHSVVGRLHWMTSTIVPGNYE